MKQHRLDGQHVNYYDYARSMLEGGSNKKQRTKLLGTALIKNGIIDSEKLDQVLKEQENSSETIGETFVRLGHASEEQVLSSMALQIGVPFISLLNYNINHETARLINRDVAEKNAALILDTIESSLLVAMADPANVEAKADLQNRLAGIDLYFLLCSPTELKEKLAEIYG